MQLKKYGEAIVAFTSALHLDPKSAKAYHNRGDCKHNLGDSAGAIEDFSQAILYNHKNAISFCNRAFEKSLLKDYAGAIADYKRAIEIDPSDAIACGGYGTALYHSGNIDIACEYWKKAVNLGFTAFQQNIDNCRK